MSAPNFTGQAIFGGLGQGINEGLKLGMMYKHYQAQEEIAKDRAMYRAIYGASRNWMKRGGMHGPIQDDDEGTGGAPAEAEANQRGSLEPYLTSKQAGNEPVWAGDLGRSGGGGAGVAD